MWFQRFFSMSEVCLKSCHNAQFICYVSSSYLNFYHFIIVFYIKACQGKGIIAIKFFWCDKEQKMLTEYFKWQKHHTLITSICSLCNFYIFRFFLTRQRKQLVESKGFTHFVPTMQTFVFKQAYIAKAKRKLNLFSLEKEHA